MDIVDFVKQINLNNSKASLPESFNKYFHSLFDSIGNLSQTDFILCALLNFSVQQLSTRSIVNPVAYSLIQVSDKALPYFPTCLLKVASYTEAHLLNTTCAKHDELNQIQEILKLNAQDEMRNVNIHSEFNTASQDLLQKRNYGLIHFLSGTDLVHVDFLMPLVNKFSDIIATDQAINIFKASCHADSYKCQIELELATSKIAIFRKTALPKSGELAHEQ